MAKRMGITVTGTQCFIQASQVSFDAVRDCMDDIRDDVVEVSSSLAPHKTGKLEKAHFARRNYVNLKRCDFSVRYKGDNRGFDYATWTHDASYNLGDGSRAKQPKQSRFSHTRLRVGAGYLSDVVDTSQAGWSDFIKANVKRKIKASIKKNKNK